MTFSHGPIAARPRFRLPIRHKHPLPVGLHRWSPRHRSGTRVKQMVTVGRELLKSSLESAAQAHWQRAVVDVVES